MLFSCSYFRKDNILFPYQAESGLWGYKNSSQIKIILPKYEYASRFNEGLALVKFNDYYGYIDDSGKLRIPFLYTEATDFSMGLAAVEALCNSESKEIVLPIGGNATDLRACSGYINKLGEFVIGPHLNWVHVCKFSEGLAAVAIFDKKHNIIWGYIDKTGKFIIKPKFKMAQPFSHGFAYVEYKEKLYRINQKGKKARP